MAVGVREYTEHMEIIKDISDYEKWKSEVLNGDIQVDSITFNMLRFLDNYNSNCTTSWADFITKYRFVRHANATNAVRHVYNIIPNNGEIMSPFDSYLNGKMPPNGYAISYDFRGKILFRRSYKTVMIDYDYKDGFSLKTVIDKLNDAVRIGSTFGLNFVFVVFPSDRGVHAYLVSYEYNRSFIWVDFLRIMCNDAYYTAFSYDLGFSARLSRKPDHPTDDVIWISPLQEKPINDEYSLFNAPNPTFNVDTNIPSVKFSSDYFNKTLDIKVPSRLNVVGSNTYIDKNLLINPYIDYVLVQYMKYLDNTKSLESDIYNQRIYPYQSNMEHLRSDIERLVILVQNIFSNPA